MNTIYVIGQLTETQNKILKVIQLQQDTIKLMRESQDALLVRIQVLEEMVAQKLGVPL